MAEGGGRQSQTLSGGHIPQGLVGHLRNVDFTVRGSEEPLQGFKTGSDMIQYAFKKISRTSMWKIFWNKQEGGGD